MTIGAGIELVDHFTVASMRRYLLLKKWSRNEAIKQGIDRYGLATKEFGVLELLLPQDESRPDTRRRKFDALRIISQYEDRSMMDVASDIKSVSYDVWRAIVPSSLVQYESISMQIAGRLVSNARELLASSATTEASPKPFFGKITKAARVFADDCRFGHTFKGSFGFSIETPIAYNESPKLESVEEDTPFERRVIQRIARGINHVARAGDVLDPLLIVDNFQTGFSANMCEDFVDLMEAVGVERLGFEFSFSPEWRLAADLSKRSLVNLEPRHVDVAKDAARKLRLQDFERSRTIVGRVVRLETEGNPTDLLEESVEREILVQWDAPDFGRIKVKVTLSAAEYLVALSAHSNGRAVSISGKIDRIGRTWYLLETKDFRVLPY